MVRRTQPSNSGCELKSRIRIPCPAHQAKARQHRRTFNKNEVGLTLPEILDRIASQQEIIKILPPYLTALTNFSWPVYRLPAAPAEPHQQSLRQRIRRDNALQSPITAGSAITAPQRTAAAAHALDRVRSTTSCGHCSTGRWRVAHKIQCKPRPTRPVLSSSMACSTGSSCCFEIRSPVGLFGEVKKHQLDICCFFIARSAILQNQCQSRFRPALEHQSLGVLNGRGNPVHSKTGTAFDNRILTCTAKDPRQQINALVTATCNQQIAIRPPRKSQPDGASNRQVEAQDSGSAPDAARRIFYMRCRRLIGI